MRTLPGSGKELKHDMYGPLEGKGKGREEKKSRSLVAVLARYDSKIACSRDLEHFYGLRKAQCGTWVSTWIET